MGERPIIQQKKGQVSTWNVEQGKLDEHPGHPHAGYLGSGLASVELCDLGKVISLPWALVQPGEEALHTHT